MGYRSKEEAAAIKAKADAEGYRPDPAWMKKFAEKRAKKRAAGKARVNEHASNRKAHSKLKKAKRRAFINDKGGVPDFDEDLRFET